MGYDVVALGELLIDFTENGTSQQGNSLFEANPGGAPCNVLAMLSKLGRRTAFIGKVGDDLFGRLLADAVERCGIDGAGIVVDREANTTLAFVKNAPDGDREFSFFRNPGADTLLCYGEVDKTMIEHARIFHFGSLSLTDEPARQTTRRAVALAQEAGVTVSFDPNLRPLLWRDMEQAKQQIEWGCSVCDLLKIAEEELKFLTGCTSIRSGADKLQALYPQIRLIAVTKGKKGADCFWGDCHVTHPPFLNVKTVDTTGAGDTFWGSCLSYILDWDLAKPDEEKLVEMVAFANAAASLITTKKGALKVMPQPEEIRALIDTL